MDDFSGFLPYIDVKGGLARLMNNKKFYAKMLRSYLASTTFESMSEPLNAGNFESAREKVHTFKGVCANLSLAKNFELSKSLEAVVKEGGDFSAVLAELKASVEATELSANQLIALFEA